MEEKEEKETAANVQFGASGGVDSSDTEQVTSSFALVPAFPTPPPDAKLPGVRCKWRTARCEQQECQNVSNKQPD